MVCFALLASSASASAAAVMTTIDEDDALLPRGACAAAGRAASQVRTCMRFDARQKRSAGGSGGAGYTPQDILQAT